MISIRRQLTRRLLGASLLLLTGGLVAMTLAAHLALVQQFDAALRAKALAISTLTEVEDGEVRVNFSDRFLRGFDDDRSRDFFTLWHEDGTRIARSESLRRRDLPRVEGELERARFWNLTLPNGRPGRAMAIAFEPKRTGSRSARERDVDVQLVVASDRRDLNETLVQLVGVAAACGLLLLGATAWIIPRVLRRGLHPLDRLATQAGKIDARSLSTRFAVAELPAELRPIAERLNDLLDRLEHSFERERRFSADLAHELRTPLAELRSLAECALKWPEARDPALDQDTLAITLRMEALVTSMLALARAEEQWAAAAGAPVALASFVEETWKPFASQAAARGLSARVDLIAITVDADRALLRSVLTNLFDNAVAYTPPGGAIAISLRRDGPRAVLTVANPIDEMSPADVDRLFDRFWRKESARSGGAHFGLGLSLAAACANAMGWSLTAVLDEQKILSFSLTSGATATSPDPTLTPRAS